MPQNYKDDYLDMWAFLCLLHRKYRDRLDVGIPLRELPEKFGSEVCTEDILIEGSRIFWTIKGIEWDFSDTNYTSPELILTPMGKSLAAYLNRLLDLEVDYATR